MDPRQDDPRRSLKAAGSSADADEDRVPGGLDAANARNASRYHGGDRPRGSERDDPLAEKHRARFDRDFRTVDYANLSGEPSRTPKRRKKQHSSWESAPVEKLAPQPSGAYAAKFAFFGGSVIAADFVRLQDERDADGKRSSSAGGESQPAPLGAPNPDGRTPPREARKYLRDDPLAAKHKPFAADIGKPG